MSIILEQVVRGQQGLVAPYGAAHNHTGSRDVTSHRAKQGWEEQPGVDQSNRQVRGQKAGLGASQGGSPWDGSAGPMAMHGYSSEAACKRAKCFGAELQQSPWTMGGGMESRVGLLRVVNSR